MQQINKKLILKLALTLTFLVFSYMPKIKLDMQDTYVIEGVLENKVRGRFNDYVIRVPNIDKGKTIYEHDVYKYPWFIYGYGQFGANNHSFCENAETLAILRDKVPVEVLYAKNIGGILQHPYMVLEVKRDGKDVECYSKNEVLEYYNQTWFRNFHPLSICLFIFGLVVIWYPKLFNFFTSRK